MNITQDGTKLNIISQSTPAYQYVHVVQDVTITSTDIVHDEITDSVSYYTFVADGYYIITEMKLPVTPGNYYYISDGEIYDPSGAVMTTEELLAVDPAGTSIVREDEDYITMVILNEYYLDLLKAKYLKNICNCGCGCIDKQDKVKLDTLTMGLDLIEALESKVQYYEVQRIVEKLSVCFNIVQGDCDC